MVTEGVILSKKQVYTLLLFGHIRNTVIKFYLDDKDIESVNIKVEENLNT